MVVVTEGSDIHEAGSQESIGIEEQHQQVWDFDGSFFDVLFDQVLMDLLHLFRDQAIYILVH